MNSAIQRDLFTQIQSRLVPNKAVIIYGARRVGKTILMHEIVDAFKGKKLVLNGEDFDVVTRLSRRSITNYRSLFGKLGLLAIDEAQHIPHIGMILKLIVDEVPGVRVLATGSSSFDLLNQTGEPLVGRGTQFLLTPFAQKELSTIETPMETQQKLESRMIYGTYPEIVLTTSSQDKRDYLQDIVSGYLLKDILAIDGLKNTRKMRDLLRLIAFQVGSMVSYDELGRQLGLSRATVEKYLDLLEKVFIIYKVGTFSNNLRKEVTKACKWYFFDNGIRNAVIGAFEPLNNRQDVGALWENYLFSELRKKTFNTHTKKDFYFWRTYAKQEIDFVSEGEDGLQAREFKWGDKVPSVPKIFQQAYPQANYKVLNPENYFLELV